MPEQSATFRSFALSLYHDLTFVSFILAHSSFLLNCYKPWISPRWKKNLFSLFRGTHRATAADLSVSLLLSWDLTSMGPPGCTRPTLLARTTLGRWVDSVSSGEVTKYLWGAGVERRSNWPDGAGSQLQKSFMIKFTEQQSAVQLSLGNLALFSKNPPVAGSCLVWHVGSNMFSLLKNTWWSQNSFRFYNCTACVSCLFCKWSIF